MLLLVLLILLVPVKTQDVLGVFHTFGADYYQMFSDKRCLNISTWFLQDYEAINVTPITNTSVGIRASKISCISSFPIVFLSGSTLELSVYVKTVSKRSGLTVSVVDQEDDTSRITHLYNNARVDFVSAWSRITMKIDWSGIGYINFIGRSRKNEIVLLNYFQYFPNNTKIKTDDDNEAGVYLVHEKNVVSLFENEEDVLHTVQNNRSEISDIYIETASGDSDIESSGDYDGSGDDEIPIIPAPVEISLRAGTLTLIVIGVVAFIVLIGAGAYKCGKLKGHKDMDFNDIDEELPPALNIPRVRGVSTSNIRKIV